MTAALEGGVWLTARSGCTLPPGKTRYPFYRRLGGPQGRSGWTENLVPTGILSRSVQPVVSRYTDWATRPSPPPHTHTYIYITLQYSHKKRDTLWPGIHANWIFQTFLRILKLILPQRVTAIAPLKLHFPERPQVLLTMGVELNTVSCTESHIFSLESISTNSRGSRHGVLTFRRQEVARQT